MASQGKIITFYSYKGGVGRSMGVANIGVLLATMGKRTLLIDWDLEAPGLEEYFRDLPSRPKRQAGGLLRLLNQAPDFDVEVLESLITCFPLPGGNEIYLLDSGADLPGYPEQVANFSWTEYFQKCDGAHYLEQLRELFLAQYDFVLIDSRTGITDSGGVCTIQMPDTLVLFFAANHQNLRGIQRVAKAAKAAREGLDFPRLALSILPIPSRFDGRVEQGLSNTWLDYFSDQLEPYYDAWRPPHVPVRKLIEQIKIPYIPLYSFDESIPVLAQGTSDPEQIGFYYLNIAKLLLNHGEFGPEPVGTDTLDSTGLVESPAPRAMFHKNSLPTSGFRADISSILKYAPSELIGRSAELHLLNDAWTKTREASFPRPHILTFVALGGEGKTSLVAKWIADLANQNWPGCDAVFAWSFYSQGTRDTTAASSNLFLKEALVFFGDPEMARSPQSAYEKGRRIAQLVAERRTILILDGLEPLQYPPILPMNGRLKDDGIAALLKALATANRGLCVVTTRYSVSDLKMFWRTTAPETKLLRLSRKSSVALLRSLGVRGTLKEIENLASDVQGHALTLSLLGAWLHDAHGGDIRKRNLVKLEEADVEIQGGHAFRVIDAYMRSFKDEGERGERLVAILRLLGLFDRPATANCLAALQHTPAIPALTESLVGLSEEQRNVDIARLEAAKLVSAHRNSNGSLLSLDAHPLVREYFAHSVRHECPAAWRAAHGRIFEHLCATTKEGSSPTLEDLQPLYQAVAHGCLAGRYEEARETVYSKRILRGIENYSTEQLGAFEADLNALAYFFCSLWDEPQPSFHPMNQAWILERTSEALTALGRFAEASQCINASKAKCISIDDRSGWLMQECRLCELALIVGDTVVAVEKTQKLELDETFLHASREDPSPDIVEVLSLRGWALHQFGSTASARSRFKKAEAIWIKTNVLEKTRGCDISQYSEDASQIVAEADIMLLEAEAEIMFRDAEGEIRQFEAAGTTRLNREAADRSRDKLERAKANFIIADRLRSASTGVAITQGEAMSIPPLPSHHEFHCFDNLLANAESDSWLIFGQGLALRAKTFTSHASTLNDVDERATQRHAWMKSNRQASLPDRALTQLVLGRSALYRAILNDLGHTIPGLMLDRLDGAVQSLRRAGTSHLLPYGLLTRAWVRAVAGTRFGQESAQRDLDEAWEIAQRGPMPLFLADIHLYRCRLFHSIAPYPWATDADGRLRGPKTDVAQARRLIEQHCYWRRKKELEDAETSARDWPSGTC